MSVRSFAAAAESIAPVYGHVPALLAPLHPYAPVGLLDVFGAARLSMGVNWVASDTKGKPRASFLQEALGILVVVFGGETFLCEPRGRGGWTSGGLEVEQAPSLASVPNSTSLEANVGS